MTERAVERLLIVGANHRSSTLALRDRLFVEDMDLPAALVDLRGHGFPEAMLLITCDRIEVIATDDDVPSASERARAFLAARAGVAPDDLGTQVYSLHGAEAVSHLFAVTSSLDSLMIGEPHVLGQVKTAHRLCRDSAMAGADLDTCLQAAFAVAKRVRSETSIAEGPVSVASAAVQTARDLFGDPGSCRLLLAGGADMGELVAESLLGAGLKEMVVTARRSSRAEALAGRYDCHLIAFDQLANALAEAEVVITAIGGRTWAVTEEAVKAALKKRRQKPILLIDCGIPGDVEPTVNRVDSAFLYDLGDLEQVAEKGRVGREAAARAAWDIVSAEVANFVRAQAERTAVPVVAALHRRFEAERARVLGDAHGDADKATRLLVGRLLHAPSAALRDMASAGENWASVEALLTRLFDLDDESKREL